MKRLLLVLAFLAFPALVHAQAITSYRITTSGGAAPVTNDLPIAGWVCAQNKVAVLPGTTHNPSRLQIDDPADNTKACTYTDPGTGPLLSLPFGGTVYTSTLQAQNSAGFSLVSNVSNPFDRPGVVPPAPTGLKALP